jgi:hypothetical protein
LRKYSTNGRKYSTVDFDTELRISTGKENKGEWKVDDRLGDVRLELGIVEV